MHVGGNNCFADIGTSRGYRLVLVLPFSALQTDLSLFQPTPFLSPPPRVSLCVCVTLMPVDHSSCPESDLAVSNTQTHLFTSLAVLSPLLRNALPSQTHVLLYSCRSALLTETHDLLTV